jgi:hypothetical protein
MGIDVYLKWPNQTEEEERAQMTGFSVKHGHVGYLREAYHGSPYATRVLVKEGFESDDGNAIISAATLRERLPATLVAARERECKVYNKGMPLDGDPITLQAFIDFVELAEKKEREHGSISVYVSA